MPWPSHLLSSCFEPSMDLNAGITPINETQGAINVPFCVSRLGLPWQNATDRWLQQQERIAFPLWRRKFKVKVLVGLGSPEASLSSACRNRPLTGFSHGLISVHEDPSCLILSL